MYQFYQDRAQAKQACLRFVMEGKRLPGPLDNTRHQLFPGDDASIKAHRENIAKDKLREASSLHRRSIALVLSEYEANDKVRGKAMAKAY